MKRDDDARLLADARAGAGRAHRIAGTRPVERDEAVAVGQPAEQRMPELMELRAEPMDEDDRPPLARFDVVDAVAVDVDEFAGWRNHLFRMRGDLAGREDEVARRPAPRRSRERARIQEMTIGTRRIPSAIGRVTLARGGAGRRSLHRRCLALPAHARGRATEQDYRAASRTGPMPTRLHRDQLTRAA